MATPRRRATTTRALTVTLTLNLTVTLTLALTLAQAAKGEGELCYDEALEFTGVLAKLVAQGLRLKFTERNTFSKDEVLGDRGR